MSKKGRVRMQTFGAAVLAFLGVVGAGAFFLLSRGSPVKAPNDLSAPADAALSMPVPAAAPSRVGAFGDGAGGVQSSPAPLPFEAEKGEASNAAPGGASSVMDSRVAAPKLGASSLSGLPTAASSARVTTAAAPALKTRTAAKKEFVAPKLDLSKGQGTVASTVHYGVSSRAELMGRAAGPVYNFAGKPIAAGQKSGDISGQALEKVEAVKNQIDNSDIDDANKAKVDQSLIQVRQSIQSGQ